MEAYEGVLRISLSSWSMASSQASLAEQRTVENSCGNFSTALNVERDRSWDGFRPFAYSLILHDLLCTGDNNTDSSGALRGPKTGGGGAGMATSEPLILCK